MIKYDCSNHTFFVGKNFYYHIDIDYQLEYNYINTNDNDYQYRDLGGYGT